MMNFVIEQQWVTEDGGQHGVVVEISDEGTSGAVDIIDGNGDRATFRGTAAAFQLLPEHWRVVI